MASNATNRLQYLLKTKTEAQISRESGIPQSTLNLFKRGERALPKQYQSNLRNTFQRTSYNSMREVGFSASQSKRFSWHSPSSITQKSEQLELAINSLTIGAVASKERVLIRDNVSYNEGELWAEMRDAIKEGLRISRKTFEEWTEYE